MKPLTEAFETQTCGRCGGSGHYSYCQQWGTTCFGCTGKGIVYTKRALAALAYGRQLRMVKASEVQVGWVLYETASPCGGRTGWFTVTKSEMSTSTWTSQNGESGTYWLLETSQGGLNTEPESEVQSVPNKARLTEVRALMLAYQATLLKTGKQAKRLSKVA